MRFIIERSLGAVEPPPPRQWGHKDAGFEYTPQALAEMAAARQALAAGGPAAAARRQQQQELQVHAEQLAHARTQQAQHGQAVASSSASGS